MTIDAGAATGLAWALAYLIHSTIWVAGAALACAAAPLAPRARNLVWRVALIGPLASLLAQSLAGPAWTIQPTWLAPSPAVSIRALPVSSPAAPEPLPLAAEAPMIAERIAPPADEPEGGQGWRWLMVVVAVILLGKAVGGLRGAWRLRRLLVGRRRVTSDRVVARLRLLRAVAMRPLSVRVTVSNRISSPIALWGNEICLPERAESDLDGRALTAVLAHELAHLERRDNLWLAIAAAIDGLFFFQPLNRFARRWLQDSAELAADERAVELTNDPLGLARSLAEVATWGMDGAAGALASPVMARRGSLRRRVDRLLAPPARRSPLGVLIVAGLAMLTLLSPAVALQTQAPAAPKPSPAPVPAPAPVPVPVPVPAPASAPDAGAIERPVAPRVRIARVARPPRPPRPPRPERPERPRPVRAPRAQHAWFAPPVVAPLPPAPPIRPVMPVRPFRMAAPVPPIPPTPVGPRRSAFALVGKDGRISLGSGSSEELRATKSAAPAGTEYLWVRRGDQKLIVTSSQALAPLRPLAEEAHRIDDKQRGLAGEMANLGARQAELGVQQAELGKVQAQLGVEQAGLGSRRAQLHAERMRLEMESRGTIAAPTKDRAAKTAELARRESELSRKQGELGNKQGELGNKQGELGHKQGQLGREQGQLGRQQGELGRERAHLHMRASAQIDRIVDEAIAQGTARILDAGR